MIVVSPLIIGSPIMVETSTISLILERVVSIMPLTGCTGFFPFSAAVFSAVSAEAVFFSVSLIMIQTFLLILILM